MKPFLGQKVLIIDKVRGTNGTDVHVAFVTRTWPGNDALVNLCVLWDAEGVGATTSVRYEETADEARDFVAANTNAPCAYPAQQ